MKILVTGKNGFLAKNVLEYFSPDNEILMVSHTDSDALLEKYCKECDFVFHMAAVQRSENEEDFVEGNVGYTEKVISYLNNSGKKCPVLYTTSIGIDKKSVFSDTKLAAEKIVREYASRHGVPCFVFKLNNIFGKYGKPNFNNVIATFCYNLANGKPLIINDPAVTLDFTYVDDLMADFEKCLCGNQRSVDYYLTTSVKYRRSLGEVVKCLGDIKNEKRLAEGFESKLSETLKSYRN